MKQGKAFVLLLTAAMATTLAGCAAGDYSAYLARKGVAAPLTETSFQHCRGYGCRIREELTLDDNTAFALAEIFSGKHDPEAERRKIAAAVGLLETYAGSLNGTDADRGGTYVKIGDDQHDCVDESVNTTIYLSLLARRGLIRHHDIAIPNARIFPFSLALGPHQTAVIIERPGGKRFAVDSWFHDNGIPPEIVPMEQWLFGWDPDPADQSNPAPEA